jgi:cytochrome c oxidase subunit 3
MKSAGFAQPNHARMMQSTLFLVLGAETVLFGTLVMSYLFFRNGGSDIPFSHPKPFDLIIASLNTLILLSSTVFARRAQHAIVEDHVKGLKSNLLLALSLGAIFIIGQIFEFNHAGMRVNDASFGGVFFALISFHAFHVIVGMVVLALNFARARVGDFSAHRHVAIIAGTWFWYYVAAVWIVLFTVLYVV